MPQPVNYAPSVCDRIIDLLKASEAGSRFNAFYYGDPFDLPNNVLPCVIVELQATNIQQGPTGMDFISNEVMIKVVINRKDYYSDQGDNEMAGDRALEQMVEGVDPTTNLYDDNSVVGIIRKNFTLVNFATNQTMEIRYWISPRGDPNDETMTECHIRFIVENLQLTPGKI